MLDICFTDNVVNNKTMITTLKRCSDKDKIYYNLHSIVNVLSLKEVSEIKGYYFSMDTDKDSIIRLHHGNVTLRFPHSDNGLHYCTVKK